MKEYKDLLNTKAFRITHVGHTPTQADELVMPRVGSHSNRRHRSHNFRRFQSYQWWSTPDDAICCFSLSLALVDSLARLRLQDLTALVRLSIKARDFGFELTCVFRRDFLPDFLRLKQSQRNPGFGHLLPTLLCGSVPAGRIGLWEKRSLRDDRFPTDKSQLNRFQEGDKLIDIVTKKKNGSRTT